MENSFVEIQVIGKFHPRFVEVELFLFQVFAPGAHPGEYGIFEVFVHGDNFRSLLPEGLGEFIEEINGHDVSGFGGLFFMVLTFLVIFFGYDEQSERFSILFGLAGVVGTVRTQDSPGVAAVELSEPFETLVNVNVMYKEVDDAINGNADTNKEEAEVGCRSTNDVGGGTGNGENQEE